MSASVEGKVIAETLADIHRADLAKDGRGDGRHAFRLKLPPAFLDGTPCRVRVEAVRGSRRVRLLRGEILLGADVATRSESGAAAGVSDDALPRAAQMSVALLVWGGGDVQALARTRASWARQDWPDTALALMVEGEAAPGETLFQSAEERRLRQFVRQTHTVVFTRAGDEIDPALARVLAETRPLGDVVTWDGDPDAGAGHRAWARDVGLLLGETLSGAFAVRGHALDAHPGKLAPLAADQRRLELWLGAQAWLRWTHLPAALVAREDALGGWMDPREDEAKGLDGYIWRPSGGDAPARLAPSRPVRRLSLGLWPDWDEDGLAALIAGAPACELELLLPGGAEAAVQQRLRDAASCPAGVNLSFRPIVVPQGTGAGGWLRALGEAATGEVVVIARHGLSLDPQAGALAEVAAWALSSRVGAVTIDLAVGRTARLTGLALSRDEEGWNAVSAFDPARAGRSRPVLAAPAAFLAVSRATLAAAGGADSRRFPDDSADLDLSLRLRRMGLVNVLLGHLQGAAPASAAPRGGPAALAAFEAADLAEAAAAFPLATPRRKPRR